jgi:hypothetical protein
MAPGVPWPILIVFISSLPPVPSSYIQRFVGSMLNCSHIVVASKNLLVGLLGGAIGISLFVFFITINFENILVNS